MPKSVDEIKVNLILRHLKKNKKSYIKKISEDTRLNPGTIFHYLEFVLKDKVKRVDTGPSRVYYELKK